MNVPSIHRRNILKSAGAVSFASLAGCLGGSGADDNELRVGHSGEDTGNGSAVLALQRAVDQHSDELEMTAPDVSNGPAALRMIGQGELEVGAANNFVTRQAHESEGEFEDNPIDNIAHQGFGILFLHGLWMAREDANIETTDDLAEATIWPLGPGWGVRQALELTLEEAGMLEDLEPGFENLDAGDLAGALEEGRIDAFAAYGVNQRGLPGWLTEVEARVNTKVVEATDEWTQAIQDSPYLTHQTIEAYGFEDLDVDSWESFVLPYNLQIGPDVSDDLVYELARISHEHVDTIRESDTNYLDHSNIEQMTDGYQEDVPVHSGMVEFLQDNDAWDDNWPSG